MIDWNAWRARYWDMNAEEQAAFYADVYEQHPDQHWVDTHELHTTLLEVAPRKVIELGGWDGQTARDALLAFRCIELWENHDICYPALLADPSRVLMLSGRYKAIHTVPWYWRFRHGCDLFVAVHTIEHLTAEHLAATFRMTSAPWLHLEAPLPQYGAVSYWHGYQGSHILEWGWEEVMLLLGEEGYDLHRSRRDVRVFRRRLRNGTEHGT